MEVEEILNQMHNFIDHDEKVIRESHSLIEKLRGMSSLLTYLEEKTPKEHSEINVLIAELKQVTKDFLKWFEDEVQTDVMLEKEEETDLKSLKADYQHKDWRAVKFDQQEVQREEKTLIRLHQAELEKLHQFFAQAQERFNQFPVFKADLKEKEEYDHMSQYYLKQLHEFCKFYESLFKELIKKEKER